MNVSPELIEKGAIMAMFSKLLGFVGLSTYCLLLFTGRLFFLPSFLSNYVFRTITKSMFTSALFMPVIARIYFGTYDKSIVITPLFSFYISFFGVLLSVVFAIFYNILVEIPIQDLIKLLWFQSKAHSILVLEF